MYNLEFSWFLCYYFFQSNFSHVYAAFEIYNSHLIGKNTNRIGKRRILNISRQRIRLICHVRNSQHTESIQDLTELFNFCCKRNRCETSELTISKTFRYPILPSGDAFIDNFIQAWSHFVGNVTQPTAGFYWYLSIVLSASNEQNKSESSVIKSCYDV